MRNCKSMLVMLAVLALATTASAQVHGPTVGVYFDQEGTQTETTIGTAQFITAYVLVTNAEISVSGMAFRVAVGSGLTRVTTAYPDGSLHFGEIDGTGVSIGLNRPRACYGDQVVEACSIMLMGNPSPIADATITVVDHLLPNEAGIHIVDQLAVKYEATGAAAVVQVITDAETSSWAEVKSLFR